MMHTPAHKYISKETPMSILSKFMDKMVRSSKPAMGNGMFKPFFVHHFWPSEVKKIPHHGSRGFTAYVYPDPEDYRYVFVKGTICSKHDVFTKSIGRESALMKEKSFRVNKRDLPQYLMRTSQENGLPFNSFLYLYKYLF
jgi:hypothetical protein